jgi:hypothetical protein
MSIKKLFENNRQTGITGKYLKKTSVTGTAGPIESAAHFSESVKREDTWIPSIDYSDPKRFANYGSAEKYYDNAFSYILDYYPYDGSGYEKTKFFNDLNPLEKYIFEKQYPKSTGYISIGTTYGTVSGSLSGTSGYFSSSAEYLQVKGGPHSGTIFSTGSNRTSNLQFGGVSGSTVEFLFKKETGIPSASVGIPHTPIQSQNQIILDVWNGVDSGSSTSPNGAYGRMTIEIQSGSEDRFYVTLQSGSTIGFLTQSVPTTGGLSLTGSWNHYAFIFNTNGAAPTLNFYVNGKCFENGIAMTGSTPDAHTSIGEISAVTGSLIANIGALRTAPSGNTAAGQGWAKLSASLDNFRFWKENRNAQQVGRYWFAYVNGGSDKYDANKSLGVNFRFNEGITQTSSIDNIFLDYSGRLSNGLFRGYNSSYTRNTGSAIDDMALTDVRETGDPILRKQNNLYSVQRSYFVDLGREHDYHNTSYLMNTLPNWIYEEDYNNGSQLQNLTQIMSSYFDTLFVQMTELRNLKDINYVSGSLTGSINEFPHNERLLTSMGLETPELFANINAFERFFKRSEDVTFDQSIEEIKNVIYKNVYNNLQNIFKSKGNEKSIRNLVRCFGIDDDIVSLKMYSSNLEFDLETNYKSVSSKKKYADFTGLLNKSSSLGTVYQHYDSTIGASQGYFTGSNILDTEAITVEGEFVFPNREGAQTLDYSPFHVVTSSLFGFHTPAAATPSETDATWAPETGSFKDTGLQVFAIKRPSSYAEIISPDYEVKDVFFAVKNRHGETVLESDVFQNAYDNQKWNLALTLKNTAYPYALSITGSSTGSYTLDLYGTNYDSGIKRQSFSISTSLNGVSGSNILTNAKKFYLGSHRTNFSGTLLQKSDVRASSLRVWNTYLTSSVIDLHAKESDAFGVVSPYKQAYTFESASYGPDGRIPQNYIPAIETLGLNWDFADVTGSDTAGAFSVSDFSSGSNKGDYESDYQGALFSQLNNRAMNGQAEYFPTSSTTVVLKEYIPTQRKQLPEYVFGDDLVDILPGDVEVFTPNRRPVNFYFSIEKSMYNSISNRMLHFFASLDDFNNLIGEPVNRYRDQYKSLDKLREIFFRRVGNVPDFDKYVRYYRWIDNTVSLMAEQLFPASAQYKKGMRTIIESHILERPKVKYNYVGDRTKRTDNGEPIAEGIMTQRGCSMGSNPRTPVGSGWGQLHAPPGSLNQQAQFPPYWFRYYSEASNPDLGISDPTIISQLDIFRQVLRSSLTGGNIVSIGASPQKSNLGDTNRVYESLSLTKDTPGTGLAIRAIEINEFKASDQPQDINYDFVPNRKKPLTFSVSGPTIQGVSNDKNMVPFAAYSSSVTTGYRAHLIDEGLSFVDFTNLHYDSYGNYGRREPMQGPFTNAYVGGLKARHVAPMATEQRTEAFKLTVADNKGQFSSSLRPLDGLRGRFRRGLTAKRPVNIANISSYTGSANLAAGVPQVGNYTRKYEVLQTSDRSLTNVDFVFRNSQYYTGSIASAYISPPIMRNAGLTGSADFVNPREQSGARVTKTIFSCRFAAPGSKQDSRPQFRDIPSDLFSPNNALPYRNAFIRNNQAGFGFFCAQSNYWGGFWNNSALFLAVTGANGLSELNDGFDPGPLLYGMPSFNNLRISGGGWAHPFNKIQRNTTQRIEEIQYNYSGFPSPVTIALTGSVNDNFNVVRPVPSGDRTPWFMRAAVGGASNTNIVAQASVYPPTYVTPYMYNQYVMSGSRYPKNITYTTSSLPIDTYTAAATSVGSVTVNTGVGVLWDGLTIILTDAEDPSSPNTVTFTATTALDMGTVDRQDATNYLFGVASTSASIPLINTNIVQAISLAQANEELLITAFNVTSPSNYVYLTQDAGGTDGDTAIGGDATAGAQATFSNFAGGAPASTQTYSFGGAVFSGSSGELNYLWGNSLGVYPASQTRVGNRAQARFDRKKNLYLFSPSFKNVDNNTRKYIDGTLTITNTDRAGNSVSGKYGSKFTEPPITSRYEPLVHKVKTFGGTPAATNRTSQPFTIAYSYGNALQGFANRKINELVGYKQSFLEGIRKRPYEILRDNTVNKTGKNITGVTSVDLMLYTETIYPKEIYTYLSGTRARLSYKNNFWKADKSITSDVLTLGTATSDIEDSIELVSDTSVKNFTRQNTRLSGAFVGRNVGSNSTPFVTSQGYVVQSLDQYPYNSQLSSSIGGLTASAYRRGYFTGSSADEDDNNYGFGLIWPMDSYLYSDSSGSLLGFISGSTPILLADAGTMASGELMMTHYGTIDDRISVSLTASVANGTFPVTYTPSGSAYYQTSSVVSAQYLYNVPTEVTFSAIEAVTAVAATASVTIDSAVPAAWDNNSILIMDISPTDGTTARTFTFTGDKDSDQIERTDAFEYNVGLKDLSNVNDIAVAFSASISLANLNASDQFQVTSNVNGSSDPNADLLQLTASLSILPGATGNSFDPAADTVGGLYTRNGAFAGGVTGQAARDGGFRAEPRSPGSVFTRPSWTAGRERKYVDGPNKGQAAPQNFPFYNTYEDFVQDARLVGKDYGIVPEFRISEHLVTYKTNASVLAAVTDSLTLTGSSDDVYDSSIDGFLTRYSTTDMMEYLGKFMRQDSDDLEFNKYPTNLELRSEAVVKFLPYDGFYPQTRTLEIASLFSQSYSGYASYSINDGKSAGPYQWRPLLKPFFAPGVLYNSIKSGVGVSFPVSRKGINQAQFLTSSLSAPLRGGLSGALGSIGAGCVPDNRRRRVTSTSGNFDFSNTDVDAFFWGDSIPFEGILKPLDYISNENIDIVSTDTNKMLHTDITASVSPDASNNDLLYRLAVSNFLGTVPEFFLKKKDDGGYVTKFVAELPQRSAKLNPQGTAPASQETPRTVEVQADTAYIMEIGLKQTDDFNLYSNPYAFGNPTSTGSMNWEDVEWDAGSDSIRATTASVGLEPEGRSWPRHRAEFAPFTPTYYYGPSLVRITYFPSSDGDITLKEILKGSDTYVEFLNSDGYYYDFDSGSFVGDDGATAATSYTPTYQWNRAWQNRQDIDDSIIVDNMFPTAGGDASPFDENKWVIMPKWECPVLDFPNKSGNYNFSSSVTPTEYTASTFGMWHQYGLAPSSGEGVYLYLSDVDMKSFEFRLVGADQDASTGNAKGQVKSYHKVPEFVINSGRKVGSLAQLVGFKPEEIMPPGQWMPERAKRLGELGDDGEKLLSEGIVAIPYYLDGPDKKIKAVTLTGDPTHLGPKLKEFRRSFTRYSLPPALRSRLLGLLPPNYPERPNVINPFGEDEYEKVLSGTDVLTIPVVYLFEHTVALTKQNLADMWQGTMPNISKNVTLSYSSVDHYMPGNELPKEDRKIFPEILEEQLSLDLPRTGQPRVDLLDISGDCDKPGFQPEIRWLVFKVKQRGKLNYTQMILEEINDGPITMSAENMLGYLSKELPDTVISALKERRNNMTKSQYHSEIVGFSRNTYNWPYDYCSLIELAKIKAVVGFRPNLESLSTSEDDEEKANIFNPTIGFNT